MDSTALEDLDKNSYTGQRLLNATPEHLHITTRREFIGPIPTSWLKSNRRTWYKDRLQRNFSSKSVTFGQAEQGQILQSLDSNIGPSALATYDRAFPQPNDVDHSPVSEGGQARGGPQIVVDEASSRPAPSSVRSDENVLGIDIPRSSATSADKVSRHAGSSAKSGLESFVTAPESGSGASQVSPPNGYHNHKRSSSDNSRASNSLSPELSKSQSRSETEPSPRDTAESIAPLLKSKSSAPKLDTPKPKSALKAPKFDVNKDSTGTLEALNEVAASQPTRLLRFDVPDNEHASEDAAKKIRQLQHRRTLHRGRSLVSGEIIKWEKMLVRIEYTAQPLPEAYDENESIKIETQMVEKWQEFIVVCREVDDEDAHLWLQFYKVRKIPEIERMSNKTRSKHDLPLNHRTTFVNLFSTLDKTVCIWRPWEKGHRIYIIRPQSVANSTEWYTFIRSALGWKRSEDLEVHVPDLGVTLQLENPFEKVEEARSAVRRSSKNTNAGLLRTMAAEQAVAQSIISTCLNRLLAFPDYEDLVKQWTKSECMGLAWKRFDRIEHIFGNNEQKMYGTIAMTRSHDLELRPKRHYPTHVRVDTLELEEPLPVEGFLVRLSSTKGRETIFGKTFSKAVYISTHDQLLCSCTPAKAHVPPPSDLPQQVGSAMPGVTELSQTLDLIYQVNPYDLEDGKIAWLKHGNISRKRLHDRLAFKEAERKTNLIHNTDSYIDLCSVTEIVPDVAEDEQNGGATEDSLQDEDRVFSLELVNGLSVRFRAFNKKTRSQWIKRLKDLVQYWQLRMKLDVEELKRIRKINLEKLHMDEQMESHIGQYAEKWEVMNAVASTLLYNVCSLSSCRTVAMSGMLYRKATPRGTFYKQTAILCHGRLLLFNSYIRGMTGKMVPTVQYERATVQDLQDCYIYSGTIAEGDLLYHNQTFDPQHPGRHVLPRVYLQDDWTSSDEDSATCFVLWSSPKRAAFSMGGGGKRARFRKVARLGVTGKAVVYMTRSRAERDLWVTAISVEIERMRQEEEEVDIV